MLELKAFCNKIKPFVTYYKRLISSYNNTVCNILEKEIKLLLPQVKRKQKHGIITTLVSSFIGLAYEGISSFLHHKQNNTLHKAVNAMNEKKTNIQLYCVDFSFCFNYLNMAQGQFSHRTEPKLDLSHKLSPRSPTMAFSSVRENVTPTLS